MVYAFLLGCPGYATSQGLPLGPELQESNLHVLWFVPV